MLSFFRSVSKSKIGTWIMAAILVAILAGFAMSDISNFGSGTLGFGMGSSTLAEAGDQKISEREMADAMQRRLQQARQENPTADYASIVGDFDRVLGALIDQAALLAFADKYGFHLSKPLVDAEIAQIPQTRGLNGKFSEQAYQGFLAQQRLTDAQVREIVAGGLLQRMMLTPLVANPHVPVGVATPYASMLLEAREGEVAAVPIDAFKSGLKATDAQLQAYYTANRNRYMVPEQRVVRIAAIGPEQVAGVGPTDQEIAAYYSANQATYAAKEMRSIGQAVVPDQATAAQIAARAKGGASLAAAAAPAGNNAAVTSLDDQTRAAYASVAGDKVAAAVFAAASGGVVGPVQSDFGWIVAKVEDIKSTGGKTLDQARAEIAAKLVADKRKQAVEDLVDKVQTAVDEGSNFLEATGAAKLPVTTTPLITAQGTSRSDAAYRAPAELAPAITAGFEIAPNDPPEIVTMPNDQGYALVSPAQVVPAAPAPLASIRDRVAADWVTAEATSKAKAAASAIAAKTASGTPLAEAVKASSAPLPAVRPLAARRIQIATATGVVPPPLRTLFTLVQGKSRMIADPEGRGFFVVKVTKVVPGNALLQPALIGRMQNELREAVTQDYAAELMTAVRAEMKARRNESAIAAEKRRLASSGG
jgi:peptidyl-prolyl cis-trans isomerase D